MLSTSARLLRLLGLLQSRRDWTGPELAERLDVTTRTVRTDVDRLRRLGYRVDAAPGVAGGYRLGIGAALPPLLLDDEEAVAVALGLRAAAVDSVTGIEESSQRALIKLENVLPSHLRHRLQTLQAATVPIAGPGPTVRAEVVTALASACRNRERLRFDYASYDGSASFRVVEPHKLVHARHRWYLVAWDLDADEWRTYRADRIEPRANPGPVFAPREPPDGDLVGWITDRLATATWQFRARVRVHASAEAVARRRPPGAGVIEPIDDGTCYLHTGSDSPEMLALYLAWLGSDFDVDGPPELVAELRTLAARYGRAAERSAEGR